jgi:hypothetical protein
MGTRTTLVRIGRVISERAVGIGMAQGAIDLPPAVEGAVAIVVERVAWGSSALIPEPDQTRRPVWTLEARVVEVTAIVDDPDDASCPCNTAPIKN